VDAGRRMMQAPLMRRLPTFPFIVTLPLLALSSACANGEEGSMAPPGGTGGSGATTSSGTLGSTGSTGATMSSSSSGQSTSSVAASTSSGSSGGVPTTCAQTNGFTGCCDGTTLYYCPKNSNAPKAKACAAGQVCGWDASGGYYGCVSGPSMADPSNQYPLDCP
jgi:hypothetical protein